MGGRTDVDTSRFRRAIWNYIQCLLGIRHDDYDYGEINQLLERSLKTFIKSACCYPERVTKRDYDRVLREFHHSEKVKVTYYHKLKKKAIYIVLKITFFLFSLVFSHLSYLNKNHLIIFTLKLFFF